MMSTKTNFLTRFRYLCSNVLYFPVFKPLRDLSPQSKNGSHTHGPKSELKPNYLILLFLGFRKMRYHISCNSFFYKCYSNVHGLPRYQSLINEKFDLTRDLLVLK